MERLGVDWPSPCDKRALALPPLLVRAVARVGPLLNVLVGRHGLLMRPASRVPIVVPVVYSRHPQAYERP